MNPFAAPDFEADLEAALVSFVASATLLRELRNRGQIEPAKAARLVAGVIEVVERIRFVSEAEAAEVQKVIASIAEEFGLTTKLSNQTGTATIQ